MRRSKTGLLRLKTTLLTPQTILTNTLAYTNGIDPTAQEAGLTAGCPATTSDG